MGLDELYERYHRNIYRYLFHLCHDASLAEDLASDTWLEVVRSIHNYHGNSSLQTWLFSIARHCWLRNIEKNHTKPEFVILSELEPDMKQDVEKEFQMRELLSQISGLLCEEPQRNQTVFKLRMDGYSFYEIGEQLSISESSARVIFFRTKERIRKQLQKEGMQDE